MQIGSAFTVVALCIINPTHITVFTVRNENGNKFLQKKLEIIVYWLLKSN